LSNNIRIQGGFKWSSQRAVIFPIVAALGSHDLKRRAARVTLLARGSSSSCQPFADHILGFEIFLGGLGDSLRRVKTTLLPGQASFDRPRHSAFNFLTEVRVNFVVGNSTVKGKR
jgi:hypothetical protein